MPGWNQIAALVMVLTVLSGNLTASIGGGQTVSPTPTPTPAPTAGTSPQLLLPEASEVLVEETSRAVVDYSNTSDGYVMVLYAADTGKKLKAKVVGPTTEYTYDLKQGVWAVLPLSDGSGSYRVTVFENVEDTKYATVLRANFDAELSSPFAPFLRPNQYVDYTDAPKTLSKAAEVTRGLTDPKEKTEAIYRWVVENLTYDKELSETVQSGYLPDLDQVLTAGKGICLDYAALMTAMLRSQGIPCKLVVGYAGKAYHAWVSVWNGISWERMDPTFASSGEDASGVTYTEQFFY